MQPTNGGLHNKCSLLFRSLIETPGNLPKDDIADYL